jgi:hypothetical protein
VAHARFALTEDSPNRLDEIASSFLASIYNLQGIALGHLYDYCADDEIFYLQSLKSQRSEP